jgi:hypothetical protein
MITTKNLFSGANFEYSNKKTSCTAAGEFRRENEILVNININGQLTKGEATYNFWANRDAAGNVNISGVPAAVIADVAAEVAAVIAEIEAL